MNGAKSSKSVMKELKFPKVEIKNRKKQKSRSSNKRSKDLHRLAVSPNPIKQASILKISTPFLQNRKPNNSFHVCKYSLINIYGL